MLGADDLFGEMGRWGERGRPAASVLAEFRRSVERPVGVLLLCKRDAAELFVRDGDLPRFSWCRIVGDMAEVKEADLVIFVLVNVRLGDGLRF